MATITTQRGTARHSQLPLLAICLGYFMVILDTMVVNVAVPSLGRDLHTGVSSLQWVVAGYTLVFAALLIAGLGWRSVFAINLPIGVLGLVGVARFLPAVPGRRRRADVPGQLLGIVLLAALTGSLIEAGALGWTAAGVLAGFAVAVVAAIAFIFTERRSSAPMLPSRSSGTAPSQWPVSWGC